VPVVQLRSTLTKFRLTEAGAKQLVEAGLAGTSTIAVAQRAGVSQGALFRHFPSKPVLLAAVVEYLLAEFVADFDQEITKRRKKKGVDPIHASCVVLWKIFRRPEMRAVFEVYVAARTDATLAKLLTPILEKHRASILEEAQLLFPEVKGKREDFEAAVDAVVYAMQGAALGLFGPDPDAEVEHLAFLERLARRELARLGGG
jgi:AcrR family transcriptional regulator